jgi:hypothetical protein
MSFAVCVSPVSPLRREPSHRSEMVSQLLFGESCMIMEKETGHWVKIKCNYDGYEGWCQDMHVKEMAEEDYPQVISSFTGGIINEISYNGEPMQLPFGCPLIADENEGSQFKMVYSGVSREASSGVIDEATIRSIAFLFLNTGYLWGGKSIFGIDCSGFTQTVFRQLSIPLLRDAYQQATQGEDVGFLQEAQCGDLAFFDNAEGRITHVGILLNEQDIIHSSGKVRIDKIDGQGIINSETGERTHNLRTIKRYFPAK